MFWDDDDDFRPLDDLANALDPLHLNDELFGNGDGYTTFEESVAADLLGEDDPDDL